VIALKRPLLKIFSNNLGFKVSSDVLGVMIVRANIMLNPFLDVVMVFCQAGSNKIYFSRADNG
jgi:hypothetical protein